MKTAEEILERNTDCEDWMKGFKDDILDSMKEYAEERLKQEHQGQSLPIDSVSQQHELLKAFLKWRLNKPYSDFQTQHYDIAQFLKAFNCG